MMKSANIKILRERPELSLVFVSFADVSSVPSLFKYIARRVIRNLNAETQHEMKSLYKEESLNLRRDQTISHIIPDWEGIGWAKMQVGEKDRQGYYCWVIKDGKVITVIHEGMKHISKRYMDSILNNFSVSRTGVAIK